MFGKITVTRCKEYVFVGMDIKCIDNGRVRILMKSHITESTYVFKSFGRKIFSSTNTPENKDLFENNNEKTSSILNDEEVEHFHRIVSKLLYVSKRARVYI